MASLVEVNLKQSNWINKKPSFYLKQYLGSFGVVYLAEDEFGEKYIVKRVKGTYEENKNEVLMLENIYHPHCIELLYYFTTYEESKGYWFNMVFEYVSTTSLWDVIYHSNHKMTIDRIVDIFYQLVSAVEYLHSRNIAHRDIKPSNVIIREEDDYVILIDFGSAKYMQKKRERNNYYVSRFYRAPELLMGCSSYSIKIDVWSLGCILWELIVGRPLFKGKDSNDQLHRIISVLGTPTKEDLIGMNVQIKNMDIFNSNVDPIIFSEVLPDEYYLLADVLQQMLKFNPNKRISLNQLLKHKLFEHFE